MEMIVVRPGVHTTVQDLGRPGYRHAGVPLGGAMDAFALRVANTLVGNPEGAAGLEITLGGVEFRFTEAGVVAVGGAEFTGVPAWRPLAIPAGGSLTLGTCRRGYRAYVAVRGGLAVPPVLGSQSTYVRAGLGGIQGRPLQEGDRLPVQAADSPVAVPPQITPLWDLLPPYSTEPVIRVVPGAQADWFGADWVAEPYQVAPQSDRMGLRLKGAKLTGGDGRDLLSSGIVSGTVQVPPDGQLILLGADAQTIGGYPQIAHVISVDLPLVAQLRPGDRIRFRLVTLAEAQWLVLKREQELALLRTGAAARWNLA